MEGYGPIPSCYIKGEKNAVAGALSRHPTADENLIQDLESLHMTLESFEQGLKVTFQLIPKLILN